MVFLIADSPTGNLTHASHNTRASLDQIKPPITDTRRQRPVPRTRTVRFPRSKSMFRENRSRTPDAIAGNRLICSYVAAHAAMQQPLHNRQGARWPVNAHAIDHLARLKIAGP
jgi:hypothetical protein